jgi:adenylate kinase
MRLILLGAPGSGKGTVAAALHEKYGVAHISTGDIFRANIKENTPLGRSARSFIEKGELVPDSVTISMLEERLSQPDCAEQFMLDGFPRTIAQAAALDRILQDTNRELEAVVSLSVPDELIIKRISERRICTACGAGFSLTFNPTLVDGVCDSCGGKVVQREDDKPETVLNRLQTYYEKTSPLEDYYRALGLIVEIDNSTGLAPAMLALEEEMKKRGILFEAEK